MQLMQQPGAALTLPQFGQIDISKLKSTKII
jgi:hypothetical protein